MSKRLFRPRFPWRRAVASALVLGMSATALYGCMMHMPGESASPPLPPLAESEQTARERLSADLYALASGIGERNTYYPEALERAAQLIIERMQDAGYNPSKRPYTADQVVCSNIDATLAGRSKEMLVVGAHYDSARGSPGANDNGTGVVALIELARRLKDAKPEKTIAFVFFVNEEPPYFATSRMGSRVWAEEAHARGERITGAISLETMGFYSDAPDSQKYPFPIGAFYPSTGSFLGFVGNLDSGDLLRDSIRTFREVATLPSEGAALPARTVGVDWSDHASFWPHGWPGIMVTDTAIFRDPNYHTKNDVIGNIDFGALARAVVGLEHTIRILSGAN